MVVAKAFFVSRRQIVMVVVANRFTTVNMEMANRSVETPELFFAVWRKYWYGESNTAEEKRNRSCCVKKTL